MTRAHPALLALGALALLAPLLLTLPGRAAAAQARDPLAVRLSSISPAVIPEHGPITLTGTVTNRSREVWKDINVQPLTSEAPITDAGILAEETRSDPSAYIGNRLVASFAQVGDLQPRQSVRFRIRVPRERLQITGAPGVYWIGVHALGSTESGRDDHADGRARTFIPLVPKKSRASVSLVLPLRADVHRSPDGRVARPRRLVEELGPHGRLGRITALADTAGLDRLTWLVDPAVLEAASALTKGNPDLGVGRATPSGSSSASPSPTGDAGPSASLDDQDRDTADQWLETATRLLSNAHVLALPFADTDVSAVATGRPGLLHKARKLSRTTMADLDLSTRPVVAPPEGYLDPDSLDRLGRRTTVLVSDHGDTDRGAASLGTGQRVLFSDSVASGGGPRPGPTSTALKVRQQVLAAAALSAIGGDRRPVVVVLPPDWDPGPGWRRADFFGGLDQPWLRMRSLPRAGDPLAELLPYTHRAHRQEVSPENLLLAGNLVQSASVLSTLLTEDDLSTSVRRQLRAGALAGVSYHARVHPTRARDWVRQLSTTLHGLLSTVTLTGTEFVTLSSSSGTLTISLVNGIDQPIEVGVRATTDSPGIRIEEMKPVRMGAGQRSTLRLHAHASTIGVHQVSVTPVTSSGERFGTPLAFSLRTSQVGRWFWAVLIAVGALLVLLIVRRVVIRVRSKQWRQ